MPGTTSVRRSTDGAALSQCAHLQLWERFRPGQTPPQSLGASRDYNVDMVPKFIMAHGNLVRVLLIADSSGLPLAWVKRRRTADAEGQPWLSACRAQHLMDARRASRHLQQSQPVQTHKCCVQVRALVHTDVVKYLEFKAVDGSYVFVKGKVSPSAAQQTCTCSAITSSST